MLCVLLFALKDVFKKELSARNALSKATDYPNEHEIARQKSQLEEYHLDVVEQKELVLEMLISFCFGNLGVPQTHNSAEDIKVEVNNTQVAEQYVGGCLHPLLDVYFFGSVDSIFQEPKY